MTGQPGFFDVEERYAALSATGDPLERLDTSKNSSLHPVGEAIWDVGRDFPF
jgi:hypothetical protein